jgi:hypothetical protein
MTVEIRLRAEAKQELAEAAIWYEEHRVDDLGIVVLAILHGSRHPQRWKRRT